MITRFPTDGTWRATSVDGAGRYIQDTKGTDLSDENVLSITKRAMVLYSEDQDPEFGIPLSIVSFGTRIYVITSGDGLYSVDTNDDELPFNKINGSNEPTYGFSSDMVTFNGELLISGSGSGTSGRRVSSYDGSTFTVRISSLTSNMPRPLCVSEHQNRLAVGDGNTVKLYDTSYVLQATMVLDQQFTVTSIRWRQNYLFIGTRNIGGEAKLFIWSGTGNAAQQGYGAEAEWIYSICEYGSSVALITSSGILSRFNGGGFTELARLPVADTVYSWVKDTAASSLVGKVANRGMESYGGSLYINLEGSIELNEDEAPGPYLVGQPGGIWEYTEKAGLWHRSGYNDTTRYSRTPTEIASNSLVFAQPHGLSNADPVFVSLLDGITGISLGRTYYAVVGGPKAFQIALSQADAVDGTVITLGGSPNTDTFEIDAVTGYGGTYIDRPGAIARIGSTRPNSFYANEIMFGGSVRSSATDSKNVIMSFGTGKDRAFFVTEKFFSQSVTDAWQKLQGFIKDLNTDSDIFIVKYRTMERFGLPNPYTVCTWTSDTTFTIDSSLYPVNQIQEDDEIEITGGANQGILVHVQSIDKSTSLYEFTVDEAVLSGSGTSTIVASNYTRLLTITKDSDNVSQNFFQKTIEGVNAWVQFKVELRGFDAALYQAQAQSATHK